MLILTRHHGESIDLLDRETGEIIATIRVMSVSAQGNVRLGFEAPDWVQILRDNAIKEVPHEKLSID